MADFATDDFFLFDPNDQTKKVGFSVSGLTAGQRATITVPDPGAGASYNGTLAYLNISQTWTGAQTFHNSGGASALAVFKAATGQEAARFLNSDSNFGLDILIPALGGTRAVTLPGDTCTLLGDAVNATILGQFTFDCDSAPPIFKADAPDTTPLFQLMDDTTAGTIDVITTGAISGVNTLLLPASGGRVVTTGTPVSGRIPFYSGTSGLVVNDADLSFATDTLTATKIVAPTSIQVGGGAVVTKLDHGTYTPTLTNVANLGASTAYECQYMRVGNIVTVSGKVDVDPTLATTATQLGMSLPVASNLGAQEDCAGVAFASGIAGQGAAIRGDATNDRAEMVWVSADITNQPMYFSFTYQVI